MTIRGAYRVRHSLSKLGIRWGTWRWTDAHERNLRYTYDLNPSSVVFDVGGYEGTWAERIHALYQPQIHIFEPIAEQFDQLAKKFENNPEITVYKAGLAGTTRTALMSQSAESSSVFEEAVTGKSQETVALEAATPFLQKHDISHIDLMKINIEGGEYELLEHLIASGTVKDITDLQIQFHNFVPDAKRRMRDIRKKLSLTHRPTYMYTFNWENWTRKDAPVESV
ncbi:MAG: FkbM family methyltransferase [Patescibacteria group bacterium]